MNKQEFLLRLKEALENDLSGQAVTENLDYYNRYITDEIQKGRSEAEVIASLGDPWMLARTMIDTSAMGHSGEVYEQESYQEEQNTKRGPIKMYTMDNWWKKLLVLLGIIGVIVLVVSIISGIISLVAPIVIPIAVVLLVLRLIRRKDS